MAKSQPKLSNSKKTEAATDKSHGKSLETSKSPVKTPSKKIKKVHLPQKDISNKVEQIQSQIAKLQGSEHHKKRKRLYYKLAKLKKALENPDKFLVDAGIEKEKAEKDLERRITKKKQKNPFKVNQGPQRHQKSCLICKKLGHTMQECPESDFLQQEGVDLNTTLCYNCGRTDHTLKNCKRKRKATLPFAVCYVCKGSGHIARDCPKNEKGMYAKGGGCYICDSVRHKASDCPENPANKIRDRRRNENNRVNEDNNEEEEEEVEGKNEVQELEPEIDEDE